MDADAFVKMKDVLIAAFPFLVGGLESAVVLVVEAQVRLSFAATAMVAGFVAFAIVILMASGFIPAVAMKRVLLRRSDLLPTCPKYV